MTNMRDITTGGFSACIDMLFRPEHPGPLRDRLRGMRHLPPALGLRQVFRPGQRDPFPDRIRACEAVGWIDAVEFWSWRTKDLTALERALGDTGLHLAAFLSEPAGRLVDPGTHPAFLVGLRDSLAVARRLQARSLIVLAGDACPGVDRAAQRAAVVLALHAAAPFAEDAGVQLLLEVLNSRVDHPGTFLDRTAEGLAIVAEVGSPAVRLLLDVYHTATMGEDPAQALGAGAGALVGHVHLADAPGRHEPGTGLIDWPDVLEPLLRDGYEGRLGLEFRPSDIGTVAALDTPAMHRLRALAPPGGGRALWGQPAAIAQAGLRPAMGERA